ncbi:MAG: hypothetical protein FWF36_03175 [Propionibacteriaceae bacterium]|nr:hypothetical protein [Propionibacteriaceae bacterium]
MLNSTAPWFTPEVSFDCLTLTADDLEAVLLPTTYYVNISDPGACEVSFMGDRQITVAVTDSRYQRVMVKSLMESSLGQAFVYRFPASFGWGGALWTVEELLFEPMPASPTVGGLAWAVLCADETHCVQVVVSYNMTISDNVNGVRDPLGVAVSLLETVWRRLSVDRPDLVPVQVPAVNPAPYQPITQPIVFATPTPDVPVSTPVPSATGTP